MKESEKYQPERKHQNQECEGEFRERMTSAKGSSKGRTAL